MGHDGPLLGHYTRRDQSSRQRQQRGSFYESSSVGAERQMGQARGHGQATCAVSKSESIIPLNQSKFQSLRNNEIKKF